MPLIRLTAIGYLYQDDPNDPDAVGEKQATPEFCPILLNTGKIVSVEAGDSCSIVVVSAVSDDNLDQFVIHDSRESIFQFQKTTIIRVKESLDEILKLTNAEK